MVRRSTVVSLWCLGLRKRSSKKHNNKPKSNSESDSSKKKTFQGKCFKCGEKGHLRKDCLAGNIAHHHMSINVVKLVHIHRGFVQPCEEFGCMMYDVSGLKCPLTSRDDLTLSAVNKDMIMNAVTKSKYFEDWYADTGTAFYMTEYLACMKDLKPCQKNDNGISGVSITSFRRASRHFK